MKAIKFLSMLMLAMALPVLVSCGDDDDEPLESVILGKWYSYKATARKQLMSLKTENMLPFIWKQTSLQTKQSL